MRNRSSEHRLSTTLPHVAPGTDPAFQQAMDKLLLQVNADNVLVVHQTFRQHADDLQFELQQITNSIQVGLCGGDPVSADAAKAFNGKLGQLNDVHWQHWEELSAVASLLRATARSYGKSEEEISASFSGAASR